MSVRLRLGVLTSLYPSQARPSEGIFAERRWLHMRARGHSLRIVRPIPSTPSLARMLSGVLSKPDWRAYIDFPAGERRRGLDIAYPRYAHRPWDQLASARSFARTGVATLLGGHGGFVAQPLDAVVCDYAWPAAAAAPLLREIGVPCVISGRGSDVIQVAADARLRPALAAGLASAGHWCAVSRDLLARMDELGGAPGRGVLVENGVDRELFQPGDRGAARAELGLSADGRLVLVVGHLIERKDPLLALEAFRASDCARDQLVFIGAGELRDALAARVRAVGLDTRVKLLEPLAPERLARWYAACDALLLCSSREGRPNVVLEALACGRPVLATNAGGTAELLGTLPECLVATREPAELGRRLAALLAAPPAPERCVAAVEHLSWDACAEALERCIEAAREERAA
ncbi:MAG: glycosyltransferase [Planctomycetes bacterium]|nr:glycosyltransferase [Planctomycetota bacterium]